MRFTKLIGLSVLSLIPGGVLMTQESDSAYLSNKETVDTIYSLLKSDELDDAVNLIRSQGDEKAIVQTWVNVQCDINNVMQDTEMSAVIGLAGAEYCLQNDHKMAAAMMLHNVAAFFMPDFDEGIDSSYIPVILEAARRQLPLRREIGQKGPLMWALWDLGVAELAAGDGVGAIPVFEEGIQIADEMGDRDGAAWCLIFLGKAKVKYIFGEEESGRKDMLTAARIIREIGEDWEKVAIVSILKSAGLE